MTRVDFYLNAQSKPAIIGRLVVKAANAGSGVLIYSRDSDSCRMIDNYLWTFPPLSFIPHVPCSHRLAHETDVLIGSDPSSLRCPNVLINLDSEVPDCFDHFERLLEIVSVDDVDKACSRKRYSYFKNMGFPLVIHDLQASR